jgi:hypothetical protein
MENMSVVETKKGTHVTSPSADNARLFFYHKGIVHFEFLEQSRTGEPALLFGNIGKVT